MNITKQLEKIGCKFSINDSYPDNKHNDSFWYDGLVLDFKHNKKHYKVYASGEVRIYSKAGNIVYDVKERNEGIKGGLREDKDLKKIGSNYTDKYYWDMNNWFELIDADDEADDGIIFYNLEEIKGLLKELKGGKKEK
jgi:hypothetical protein